jgi:hypothetical protein
LAQPRHLRYFLPAGLSRFAKETRMSDKRTTPDPAETARRRKRRAPTIDLTATDVSAAETDDGQPSGPPAAQHEAEAAGGDEAASATANNSSSKRLVWLSVPALAGGFIGAAVVVAVLTALWFAGAIPVRYAASDDSSGQIAALEKQVRDLQNRPADPSVSERLSAADNAMKSLGIALAALNKRNDEVAAGAADARTRADAAEKAISQLRNSVQDLTRNTSAGLSPADVDTVQKRLAELEQTARKAVNDNAVRLALSAAALRDAAASGVPFTAELAQAKSLGADEKILAPLAPFAASGVPAATTLAQELRGLIPAMRKASGAQGPTGSFLERLQANAGKLVRIRPVDAPAGDDPSAVLARIETESARADIDSVLEDLDRLDAAVRAPAQQWISKVQARQAALVAARQLAAETARTLGKQ